MTWNVFREHVVLQELAVIHEAEEALGRDYAGLSSARGGAKRARTAQYVSFLAGLQKLQSRVERLDRRLEAGASC